MNTLLSPPVILAFSILLIVSIGLAVFFRGALFQHYVHRIADRLEGAFPTDRTRSVKSASFVSRTLERYSQTTKRPGRALESTRLNSKGRDAYARAQLILAADERLSGNERSAADRLQRVRAFLEKTTEGKQFLLNYYLAVEDTSAEVVPLYLEACRRSDVPRDEAKTTRAERLLKRACSVDPGLTPDELKLRIRWNGMAAKLELENPWPLIQEAQSWSLLKVPHRCLSTIENARHKFPDNSLVKYWSARLRAEHGEAESARDDLISIGGDATVDDLLRCDVAWQLAQMDCLEQAEEVLASIADSTDETRLKQLTTKARIQLMRGEPAEAVALLDEALVTDPRDAECALLAARTHFTLKDDARACAVLESAELAKSSEPAHWWVSAHAFWNVGRFADAAKMYERCAAAGYRKVTATLRLATSLLRSGDYEKCLNVAAEPCLAESHAADAAFLKGAAYYRTDRLQPAYGEFERAFRLATQAQNNRLSRAAYINTIACLHKIAALRLRENRYAEAAKIMEVVLKGLANDNTEKPKVKHNLRESYVRQAIEGIESGKPKLMAAAATALEKAIALKASKRLSGILAGVFAKTGKYAEAIAVYDQLLVASPDSETVRFARAFCLSKCASPESGAEELERISQSKGGFRVRAALVTTAKLAERGEYELASERLAACVSDADSKGKQYFGNACAKAIWYAVKAKRMDGARRLAADFLSGGDLKRADYTIGALLAKENEYDAALGYLESGAAAATRSPTQDKLINSVYLRIVARMCREKNFTDALGVLQRAQSRDRNPQLRQLADLVRMTLTAGSGGEEFTPETLKFLSGLVSTTNSGEPMLIRAVACAHHRVAYGIARKGNHAAARSYWQTAHRLWKSQIRSAPAFWNEYITSYNNGKQHLLRHGDDECPQRLARKMAGLCIRFMGDLLHGIAADGRPATPGNESLWQESLFYWNEAQDLIGKDKAVEIFKELVKIDDIVLAIDPKSNPDQVRRFYMWLYDNVVQSEEYRIIVANMAFDAALRALRRSDARAFCNLLSDAGATNADMKEIAGKVNRLGYSVVAAIISEFNRHPIGITSTANPDVGSQLLFRTIMVFADVRKDLNQELNSATVGMLFPKVIEIILQSFGN